jgi:predicted RNA binding protein YcfA (HicA-like mRNA interferase family)
VIRIKSSHHFLQHPDGRVTVVPAHSGEIIGPAFWRKFSLIVT